MENFHLFQFRSWGVLSMNDIGKALESGHEFYLLSCYKIWLFSAFENGLHGHPVFKLPKLSYFKLNFHKICTNWFGYLMAFI